MSFGNNLRTARKEKGITQEQLADMLNVSRQAVSKWESENGYPETEKLLTMSKLLGVSLDYLMDNRPATDAEEADAVDRVGFFGAHRVILGWYEDEETVKKEMNEILKAMEEGETSYTLKYFTDVRISLLGTAARKNK